MKFRIQLNAVLLADRVICHTKWLRVNNFAIVLPYGERR